MSEKIVYSAINKVAGELASIGIGKNKQAKNYKFRGIDDVYNNLSGLLAKENLCIIPICKDIAIEERKSSAGGYLRQVTVSVDWDIVSSIDGSSHRACTYGEAMDVSDKATNKAMSTAYKYLCFMLFCIPVEGDNDTENHTHEVKSTKEATSSPKKTPQPSESPPSATEGSPVDYLAEINECASLVGDYGLEALWERIRTKSGLSGKDIIGLKKIYDERKKAL